MSRPVDHITESRPAPAPGADRSLGELFAELTHETTELVKAEVTLAKAEMSQKAASVGKDVGYLAAGAAVAYAGLLAIIAAVIIAVAHALPWWLSALLVGLVVTGIGAYLVWSGIEHLKKSDLAPRQTIQTIQEDQQWAKQQTS